MRIAIFNLAILVLFFLGACAKSPSDEAVKLQIDKVVNRNKDGDEKASEGGREIYRLDLNGDNIEDVIAFFTIEGYGGGNMVISHMTVLISKAFSATELGTVVVGSFPTGPIRFKDGVIEIDELVNGPTDGHCCPTQNQVARYSVVGEVKQIAEPVVIEGAVTTIAEASPAIVAPKAPIVQPMKPLPDAAGPCSTSPFVMKGLCVGMPMAEAVAKLETLLEIDLISYDPKTDKKNVPLDLPEVMVVSEEIDLIVGLWTVQIIGRNGFLFSLIVKTSAVSKLFNAGDLSPEDFANKFAAGYAISNMEGKYQQIFMHNRWVTVRTWSHRFDGVNIQIMGADEFPAKSVSMTSVVKEADRAFD